MLSQVARNGIDELRLDGHRLSREPEAIVMRVLDAALDRIAPDHEAPVPKRLERLETLVLEGLLPALNEGRVLRRTLRGVLIEVDRQGSIRLAAAPPRRAIRERR